MDINPNAFRSELFNRAKNFVGKKVETTSGEVGRVIDTYVDGGVIALCVEVHEFQTFWTDNEHATIVSEGV